MKQGIETMTVERIYVCTSKIQNLIEFIYYKQEIKKKIKYMIFSKDLELK